MLSFTQRYVISSLCHLDFSFCQPFCLLKFVTLLPNSSQQDEDVFFRDYAESHKKLSELGFTPTSTVTMAITDCTALAHTAVGVAVAAAVVAFSYLYEIRRKMK